MLKRSNAFVIKNLKKSVCSCYEEFKHSRDIAHTTALHLFPKPQYGRTSKVVKTYEFNNLIDQNSGVEERKGGVGRKKKTRYSSIQIPALLTRSNSIFFFFNFILFTQRERRLNAFNYVNVTVFPREKSLCYCATSLQCWHIH